MTSPLEILANDVDAIDVEDLLLELDIFGAFIIYRDPDRAPPSEGPFMTFCVAYMPEYGFVQHNTFSMVKVELLGMSDPSAAR